MTVVRKQTSTKNSASSYMSESASLIQNAKQGIILGTGDESNESTFYGVTAGGLAWERLSR